MDINKIDENLIEIYDWSINLYGYDSNYMDIIEVFF